MADTKNAKTNLVKSDFDDVDSEKIRMAFQFFDQGLNSKQIAVRIGESPNTIRSWKKKI